MRVSFDTNILVYAYDRGAGERWLRASDLLRRGVLADVVLTQQVLGEFLAVAARRRTAAPEVVASAADSMMSAFPLVATPAALLLQAFERARRYRLQFWDAVIVTVCVANSIDFLLSEDMQDGMKIDGVIIVDPFTLANAPFVDELLQPLATPN